MSRLKWRTDIQGLRAVAVLGVVLFHAGVPFIEGGFVGVDVFFVISGFLITGMLFPPIDGPTRSTPQFLASRVRRLLPASLVTLVIVTIVTWLTIDPIARREIFQQIRYAALQISNITLARESNDYLAGDTSLNPVMHFWTLGLEWQYYILWAIVVAVLVFIFKRNRTALRAAVTTMLIVLFVTTLVTSIIFTPMDPGPAYFMLYTRAWEFALGGLVFLAGPLLASKLRDSTSSVLAWLGLLGIIASFLIISRSTSFPGYAALLPTLSTALVIIVGTKAIPSKGPHLLLDNRVTQRIGATSYSWYLWHWPFLVFALLWFGELPLWTNLCIAALSYLAAEASYMLVEQPVRNKMPILKKTPVALIGAVIAISLTAGFTFALTNAPSPANADPQAVKQAININKDKGLPYLDGCHRSIRSTNSDPCYYGDLASKTTIAIWGDSHAAQWLTPINAAAKENNWKIAYYTKSACSVVDHSVVETGESEICKQWRLDSLEKIIESDPALLIVGGRWQRPSLLEPAEGIQSDAVDGITDGDSIGAVGLRATTLTLNAAKIPTVLLVDSPLPPQEIARCVSSKGLESDACNFPLPSNSGQSEQIAAAGLPYIHVVDLNDTLCPDGVCQAVIDGSITFRDEHHLSEPFVKYMTDEVSEAIKPYLR